MEKELHANNAIKRILITGPESTGKSELSEGLARKFGGHLIPEYAREYIQGLIRPYEFKDVEHIARHQVKAYQDSEMNPNWIFFDTWLIITRVWFKVVFDIVPDWIDDHIRKASFDMVLLCSTDLPWVQDSVRENGGKKREKLLDRYKYELDRFGYEWVLVTGTGDDRFTKAINHIENYYNYGKT